MDQSRPHSPTTAGGRERRRKVEGGLQPSPNLPPSWPGEGRAMPRKTAHRRKAKARHPDCATDTRPHRALSRAWFRARLTEDQAAAAAADHGALGERALTVYLKMLEKLG